MSQYHIEFHPRQKPEKSTGKASKSEGVDVDKLKTKNCHLRMKLGAVDPVVEIIPANE